MKLLAECFVALLSLIFPFSGAVESPVELKSGHELCALFREMKSTLKGAEVERKIRIKLGRGERLSGVLNLTSKGNGTLHVANLLLRTFDEHDDGIVYKDGCIQVASKDLNKDRYLDLEVSGVVLVTDEKSDQPAEEKKVELLYYYVPKERRFSKISKSRFDFIELN